MIILGIDDHGLRLIEGLQGIYSWSILKQLLRKSTYDKDLQAAELTNIMHIVVLWLTITIHMYIS